MTDRSKGTLSPLDRFTRSMEMDLDTWREGTGYDLTALAEASAAERKAIERLVIKHAPRTWHDIEAMAALDTAAARSALLVSLDDPDPMVRAAVTRFAGNLIGDDTRTAAIVSGLQTAEFDDGLIQILMQVEEYHPPAVLDALFDGALHREGEVAMHFAAMILYLHGKAEEAFDWEWRPFLLRFNTEDRAERASAFAALQELVRGDGSNG